MNLKTVNDLRTERWLLPDGVNELMPEDAWRVESLRRLIMDNCHRWGYELVMPPLIEYLDSLLTGTGETLDLQTFKFVDQYNGRTLGVRADMTPQVARIDARTLSSDQPNRLFYTGSVLRTLSDGAGGSRTPLQFGAELFGHAGPESDMEIIQLMVDSVALSGMSHTQMLLDIGHVGVFRGLMTGAALEPGLQEQLYQAMLRGSNPEIAALLGSANASEDIQRQFATLASLSGESHTVLTRARQLLDGAGETVADALTTLERVVNAIQSTFPELKVHIDLAELRGYRYHTGMLFALYDDSGAELARGGRYDSIGESFGKARPATGFSGDLVALALARQPAEPGSGQVLDGIWVDQPITAELWQTIRQLRNSGERVVVCLEGTNMDPAGSHCNRLLVLEGSDWVVEPLNLR